MGQRAHAATFEDIIKASFLLKDQICINLHNAVQYQCYISKDLSMVSTEIHTSSISRHAIRQQWICPSKNL